MSSPYMYANPQKLEKYECEQISVNTPNINCTNGENKNIFLRRKTLMEKLHARKLTYVPNGICDSFVKFNCSPINIVVNTIENKENKKSKRHMKLLKKLNEKKEEYDKNNFYYQQYIRNGGNIDYAITEGIKEWFYKHKTTYCKHLKQCKNQYLAQAIALNEYIKKNGSDKYTKMIKATEIILKIY